MQANYTDRVAGYVNAHKVSLGLLLASYGAFYLSSVLLSLWTVEDWGKDTIAYPVFSINTILPRSTIDPIFFVTSVPALIFGAALLCLYTIRGIQNKINGNHEYVAIALTVFGFFYQVVGAWPLQKAVDFPWQWQKQIVANGPIFAWGLYILSLIMLVIGAISLYRSSVVYHEKHEGEA